MTFKRNDALGGSIMGILVNIDMPQNCFQCPMARGCAESVTCQVTGSSINTTTKRLEDCPILFGDIKIMPDGGYSASGSAIIEINGKGLDETMDDVVRVVRCKDCKYGRLSEKDGLFCEWHYMYNPFGYGQEGYCLYGERSVNND